jgi:hypothetical protein
MQEFLKRVDAPSATGLREQEGEIAGISFRVRGAGPPPVLCCRSICHQVNGSR